MWILPFQEQQLKKIKAKQRRLRAALGVTEEESDPEQQQLDNLEDGEPSTYILSLLLVYKTHEHFFQFLLSLNSISIST